MRHRRRGVAVVSTVPLAIVLGITPLWGEVTTVPSADTQSHESHPTAGRVLLQGKEKEFANFLRPVKWQFGQISICWENPDVAQIADLRMIRQSVADTWEKTSSVKFSGWGPCGKTGITDVRVRLADQDPKVDGLGNEIAGKKDGVILNIFFQHDPYLKKQCTQDQTSRNKCIRGMAIHEFGHILGFAHEQNRQDTPQWCKDFKSGRDGDWTTDIWDRDSVMDYCSSTEEEGQAWPQRQDLSDTDIYAVQILYGAPPH